MTDNHVYAMHPRHTEVKTKEEAALRGMRSSATKYHPANQMFLKLVGRLHAFDAQEHHPNSVVMAGAAQPAAFATAPRCTASSIRHVGVGVPGIKGVEYPTS